MSGKILLYCPFKTGTNKLRQILGINGYIVDNQGEARDPNSISGGRLRYYDRAKYAVAEHVDPLVEAMEGGKCYDLCFIGVRRYSDQLLSGYFQDIDNPDYVHYWYGPREDVLSAHPSQIVEHFLSKLDYLKTMDQFSIDNALEQVGKVAGCRWPDRFSKSGITLIQGNDRIKEIVVFTFDTLSNGKLERFMKRRGFKWDNEKVNAGSKKFYGKKYKEVKKLYLDDIRDRLRSEDELVMNRFRLKK